MQSEPDVSPVSLPGRHVSDPDLCVVTRPVVAVDLASKFSAVVSLDQVGSVMSQWDSAGMNHREFARKLWDTQQEAAAACGELPVVVVEDLPQHVPSSLVTKSVAQLQGRIVQQFEETVLVDLYFVPPAFWEQGMGVWRKPLCDWELLAEKLGYRPPDLLGARGLVPGVRGQSGAVKDAVKQQSDYVAAFLIGVWAQRAMREGAVWDTKIVKRLSA